jgi:hypothetical protein
LLALLSQAPLPPPMILAFDTPQRGSPGDGGTVPNRRLVQGAHTSGLMPFSKGKGAATEPSLDVLASTLGLGFSNSIRQASCPDLPPITVSETNLRNYL